MKKRWRVEVWRYCWLSNQLGPELVWSETFRFKWMAKLSYWAWTVFPGMPTLGVLWAELKEVEID